MDAFVRSLRRNPTEAERHLWYQLRLRQVDSFKFRRQRPIGPYVCDFVCLSASLIVELVGSQHAEQMDYDRHRDAYLKARGFRVLRFWNDDVLRRTEIVLDTIFEALRCRDMEGRLD